MSRFLFTSSDKELVKIFGNQENIAFLDTLFLIFHQIFLYRLQDVVLDEKEYGYLMHPEAQSFREIQESTLYYCYKNIIDSVLSDSVLQEYFQEYNSYEKISFWNFVHVARVKIGDFSASDFWILLKNQKKEDILSLDARLIDDFSLTEECYEYMNQRG